MTPEIELTQDKYDSDFNVTRKHFGNLFSKFSHPIYIFNLTKKKNQRECLVADAYEHVVTNVINKELPKPIKLNYIQYDMKEKKKERNYPYSFIKIAKKAA